MSKRHHTILPHKTWNVWNAKNRAKVEADERKLEIEEEIKSKKKQKIEREKLYNVLIEKAQSNLANSESKSDDGKAQSSDIGVHLGKDEELYDKQSASQGNDTKRIQLFDDFSTDSLYLIDKEIKFSNNTIMMPMDQKEKRKAAEKSNPYDGIPLTNGLIDYENKLQSSRQDQDATFSKPKPLSKFETIVLRKENEFEKAIKDYDMNADQFTTSHRNHTKEKKKKKKRKKRSASSSSSDYSSSDDDRKKKRKKEIKSKDTEDKREKLQKLRKERLEREARERKRALDLLRRK